MAGPQHSDSRFFSEVGQPESEFQLLFQVKVILPNSGWLEANTDRYCAWNLVVYKHRGFGVVCGMWCFCVEGNKEIVKL